MCSQRASKIILIILNAIFILLGLGLVIPGALLLSNKVNDEVLPALQSVSFGTSNLGDMAKGLSVTLIVFGSFVLLLSFIGACGACCEWRPFLVVYMVIVAILFLGKVVLVILWIVFNTEVQNELKTNMKNGLNKFKTDSLTDDETSTGWNYLQMNFECCGIDAVGNSATNDYDTSEWQTSTSPVASTDVPLSCCPGVTSSSYQSSSAQLACRSAKNSPPVGHHAKGCYDAVKDFAEKYSIAFIVVGVFILILEVLVIILACVLCKSIGKDMVV